MKTDFPFIYINDEQRGKPMGEGLRHEDVKEYLPACWKQRIHGSLFQRKDMTVLDGRVVPLTAAMYADELLRQLETAVQHIENLQKKYQPEIPFATGEYKFVIDLAKGKIKLKPYKN